MAKDKALKEFRQARNTLEKELKRIDAFIERHSLEGGRLGPLFRGYSDGMVDRRALAEAALRETRDTIAALKAED